jgi:hypothetical protein
MNRCSPSRLNRARLALVIAANLALLQGHALGQTVGRPIPPQALRGTLVVVQPPDIVLNGQPERLSPGARIRATNNLLVLSGTLVGQALEVRYVREPQGQVHEVWILTEAEAQQPAPQIP